MIFHYPTLLAQTQTPDLLTPEGLLVAIGVGLLPFINPLMKAFVKFVNSSSDRRIQESNTWHTLTERISKLEADLDSVQKQLSRANQRIDELTDDIQYKDRRIDDLLKERDRLVKLLDDCNKKIEV